MTTPEKAALMLANIKELEIILKNLAFKIRSSLDDENEIQRIYNESSDVLLHYRKHQTSYFESELESVKKILEK